MTRPAPQTGLGGRPNALALLGVSPSLTRLIRYFAIRPAARPHLRLLQRELGLGSASVQRDLKRLAAAGVVRPVRDLKQRTVRYTVVAHRFWEVARTLVAASDEPAELLREALRDVAGVEAAFLFGSSAAGTAQPQSDVDVLVVGDAIDARALYRGLFEVGQVLGRQVTALRYTRATLAERLASGAEFPRAVLEEPKIWLAGDPSAIAPIATAAGVRFGVDGNGSGGRG